ncbi:helix-turn-helix domain-containing protein [Azospirillum doebereinerae]|uniref:Helix-turn-helix domain-containing protein n=1 Tax=Azospirillum doebereinerae TaxID=92933 RepID=A0A3S0VE28_9PROT|nr:helix-turn-helix domain-containing protein [Azospirillum doebereinerae]MCG5239964.1 helix-turn-helix domain-containing protein [Azospirillum doebereinerae]RUQ62053.1 helix-turn-helix domain-containing protein [Azospirillum doebereinerae]
MDDSNVDDSGTVKQVLPCDSLDTSRLPPEARLDALREAMGVLLDVTPADSDEGRLPARFDAWLMGPAVLAEVDLPSLSYIRTPGAIARDGRDCLMVQVYREGQSRVVGGASETIIRPGDLMITDFAQPIATEETRIMNISLMVPRDQLAPLLRDPDAHGGRRVAGDRPLARLVGAHLSSLAREAPHIPVAEAETVLAGTLQLVAAALNGEPDAATVGGVRGSVVREIRAFIDANILDPGLGPDRIMAVFRIPRSTLYRLFQPYGGIVHHIQRRRLHRALADLSNPGCNHMTVAEFGAMAGYTHPHDFIRAFRRAFGMTPGDVRHQARLAGRARWSRPTTVQPAWVDWIRAMN